MNRIILIGNGFDLAHGLKTSYNNFLDDYWKTKIEEMRGHQSNEAYRNDEFSISRLPSKSIAGDTFHHLKKALSEYQTSINFNNQFLQVITEKSYIDNWVDVENEYYRLLKKSYSSQNQESGDYTIENLNEDFSCIKKHLKDYLNEIEEDFQKIANRNILQLKTVIGQKIYWPINPRDLSESYIDERAKEEYELLKPNLESLKTGELELNDLTDRKRKLIEKINLETSSADIKRFLQNESALNYFDLIPNQTLFLNFNYTFTEDMYANPREFNRWIEEKYTFPSVIRIHGTISESDDNPMIFGFGDELDDDYKIIEGLNDNHYLENIKSINYLETDNYKKLIEFVNSSYYQIFIFGHSCGISDRTLLNSIFEHQNCVSIKPFYHKRTDSEDNYSDIIRNISRNFNDKAKMRDIVVNKKYCEPLS